MLLAEVSIGDPNKSDYGGTGNFINKTYRYVSRLRRYI